MNIRILLIKAMHPFTTGLSFNITEGYVGRLQLETKKLVINYCPFCGIKLIDFYDASYVQEIIQL